MRKLRERLTYANVMSTLTMFLFLGTGTAYATHLIVNSSDVVDESLVSADLKNGGAVKAADVASDTLTGAKINESTLGRVPSATIGGLGRSAANGNLCDPEGTGTYVRCVQVQLDLPSPARVLLNGRVSAFLEENTSIGAAECRWGGVQESGGVVVVVESNFLGEDLSLVGLTNVIPAGQGYTFALECREPGGIGIRYRDAWITAVAISPA